MFAFPTINPLSTELLGILQKKVDEKTKPLGSLGVLEDLAVRVGCIQGSLTPVLTKPTIIVFAGDHGIAHEGVSPYPQEVTRQMVGNFLDGGAAINVFARQNGLELRVVDVGVNADLARYEHLTHAKVARGTRSFLRGPAMTVAECELALASGIAIIDEVEAGGSNCVGFGEMGIGNTFSASALFSVLCNVPVADCVGRGTGLDDEGLRRKCAIIERAIEVHRSFLNHRWKFWLTSVDLSWQ